jgi:uncharacterized protein YaiE (UPF0345 family)
MRSHSGYVSKRIDSITFHSSSRSLASVEGMYDGGEHGQAAGADRFCVVNNDVTVDTKGATDAGRWREGGGAPPLHGSASATLHAPGRRARYVLRDLDTCPGPARPFSPTHPKAHVGR